MNYFMFCFVLSLRHSRNNGSIGDLSNIKRGVLRAAILTNFINLINFAEFLVKEMKDHESQTTFHPYALHTFYCFGETFRLGLQKAC